ncbi:hypothetical protein SAMN05443665_105633 [Actinomadura meyerae]|uniref:Uncharacterized protein n=1 Tax=Actinomadura meyerae TaxID=240840 RepID=A0A239P0W7_9ACTN|nr:hypothetical protein [Actinomadura meyerae]SNT60268.1 hypothetical protein SAMN05443665_105633 [Actinomadura meyerae]
MTDKNPPSEEWARLKPDTLIAVEQLSRKLQGTTSSRELIDSYLYAKRLLAESMRAFVRMELPERCEDFRRGCAAIEVEMRRRYGGMVPEGYLIAPYKSRVNEELYCLLHRSLGEEVPGSLLCTVTADSVHTERRIRELRELGFSVSSSEAEGVDFYSLKSLEPDFSMIPSAVMKVAQRKKFKEMPKDELRLVLGLRS